MSLLKFQSWTDRTTLYPHLGRLSLQINPSIGVRPTTGSRQVGRLNFPTAAITAFLPSIHRWLTFKSILNPWLATRSYLYLIVLKSLTETKEMPNDSDQEAFWGIKIIRLLSSAKRRFWFAFLTLRSYFITWLDENKIGVYWLGECWFNGQIWKALIIPVPSIFVMIIEHFNATVQKSKQRSSQFRGLQLHTS